MNDLGLCREFRMILQFGGDLVPISDQDEARVGVPDKGNGRGRNDHAGTVIPAHCVERYGDWIPHSPLPI